MTADLLSQIVPFTVAGLVTGAIYALLAFGYAIIYRVLHLINFAHAEVFMVGSFGALLLTQALGIVPFVDATMPHGIALLGAFCAVAATAAVVSGLLSAGLELGVYRPLRRHGGGNLAALIASLGASLFLQEVAAIWQGRDLVSFPALFAKAPLVEIGPLVVRNDQLLVLVLALAATGALYIFMHASRFGRSIRAVALDPVAATLVGVDSSSVILLAFLLAGASAGVAATLYLILYGSTSYLAGFMIGIKGFTAAVLGGMGSINGALLGGLLIGLIENYGAMVTGSQWQGVYAFAGLLLILLVRPRGLVGERAVKARM
jgi:branched-chain amino acid transport system permease protein